MVALGQGLSVSGEPGPSVVGGATASPTLKGATSGASKGTGKTSDAAAVAKSDESSSSPQRHSIQKTMSK